MELLEKSRDGKAILLITMKDGNECLYVEISGIEEPIQLGKSSQEMFRQDKFPKEHIQEMCEGFKEAGYPISEEWQRKWDLGALSHIQNKEKQ